MEEDIKYWLGVLEADNFNKSFIELVENLIARNKELEEKLQDKIYKFLCDNPYIDTFDIREIIMLEQLQEDYIPKSRVREKIEEYNKIRQMTKDNEIYTRMVDYIDILQELLEERN